MCCSCLRRAVPGTRFCSIHRHLVNMFCSPRGPMDTCCGGCSHQEGTCLRPRYFERARHGVLLNQAWPPGVFGVVYTTTSVNVPVLCLHHRGQLCTNYERPRVKEVLKWAQEEVLGRPNAEHAKCAYCSKPVAFILGARVLAPAVYESRLSQFQSAMERVCPEPR